MNELKQKSNSLEKTTHDRVLKETSKLATKLAKKWGCSKIELYRYLVEEALENGAQLIVSRKDTNK